MIKKLIIEEHYKVKDESEKEIFFNSRRDAELYVRRLEEKMGLYQNIIVVYSEPDLENGKYGFTKVEIYKINNSSKTEDWKSMDTLVKLFELVYGEKTQKYLGKKGSLSLMRGFRIENKVAKNFSEDLSFCTYITHEEIVDCDEFEKDSLENTLKYLRRIIK